MISSVGYKPVIASGIDTNQVKKQNEIQAKTQEVEQDKIQEIRKAIKKGEYKVDLQATSEKMALNLLGL
ncbi:flagellar biosynthesis anti-sigma factor FlgM [Helicobacter sp. faydin-H20]|uniref:flagellar biosynthesis anti-sigma factor FlgM n=1 Tax=Helicobacter anatolicus TaxID=2905874 RepID=UPI001E333942|nr:flagellar biosynthesis anti-sigma factor FlgM [Helicobacter anatolicus]MCE3036504.1 flagellar biosynthesis anti-sigma factor FlgM [Helicobacter anatolicus]